MYSMEITWKILDTEVEFTVSAKTTGTFRIPLNSKDKFDKSLSPGKTYKFIVAYGKTDNMKTGHSYRGTTKLTL